MTTEMTIANTITECTKCGQTVADEEVRCPACNRRVRPLQARTYATVPNVPRRPAKTRIGALPPIAPNPVSVLQKAARAEIAAEANATHNRESARRLRLRRA
jgi:hypothetical protein